MKRRLLVSMMVLAAGLLPMPCGYGFASRAESISPSQIQMKRIDKKEYLYDRELHKDFGGDGSVEKGIWMTLPTTPDPSVNEVIESQISRIICEFGELPMTDNILLAIDGYLKTFDGKVYPKFQGPPPEYADIKKDLSIHPYVITDSFVGIEVFSSFYGRFFMSAYETKPVLIPYFPKAFPKGISGTEGILLPGHDKELIALLKKHCDPQYSCHGIRRVPDNIRVMQSGITFCFNEEELSCRADGEVEVTVPYTELRQYMPDMMYRFITGAKEWKVP